MTSGTAIQSLPRDRMPAPALRRRIAPAIGFIASGLVLLSGCSKSELKDKPTVTVQVAQVEKTTIQHTITTQAILFPRAQAAIVPKITAPVQKYLIKRGSPVHAGELLAVLENRDLAAAVQDTQGTYKQQQA